MALVWMGEGHKNLACKKGEGRKILGMDSGEGHENIRPPIRKICGPPPAVSNGSPLSVIKFDCGLVAS